MAILKFKDFKKVRNEAKEIKLKETAAKKFKQAYYEKLAGYGVNDASLLSDEQLTEFLDQLKTYRNSQ
jgi:hypothetical protein